MPLNRRKFLKAAILFPSLSAGGSFLFASTGNIFEPTKKIRRVRPGDALWSFIENGANLKRRYMPAKHWQKI